MSLNTLYPLPVEMAGSDGIIKIHRLRVKQIPQVARIAEQLADANNQDLLSNMIALIALLTNKTASSLEKLATDAIAELFEKVIAVNSDFFQPSSVSDETTAENDSHRDWAYILQKLRNHGHTAPENYTITQVKVYLTAIDSCERDRLKDVALSIRVGVNADAEQWQDFVEELS